MRISMSWMAAAVAGLALLNSCSSPVAIDIPEPVGKGEITLKLPAELDSKAENAFNSLSWDSSDQPVLVQIAADKTFMVDNPTSVVCAEDGTARMHFSFPSSEEEHRFCFLKTGLRTPAFGENPSLDSWPLNLPSVQTPGPDGIDPQADVLVSGLTFSLSQDILSENELDIQLRRENAIARLVFKGVPEDHALSEIVISSPENFNGRRMLNLNTGEFKTPYGESTLTLKFTEQTCSLKDNDGNRVVWASFWPCVLETFQVRLKTVDPAGRTHEYSAKNEVFGPSVRLEAQCLAEWTFQMKNVSDKPVLPATPAGPEGVIHGKEGPTLDLFKKIKAYADNGISMVEDWWTHQVGYEGVTIHEAKLIQYGSRIHMWIVEADPALVGFALGTPYDSDAVPASRKQTVSGQCQAAQKAGKTVIAAINGDAWGARGKDYSYGVMFKDGVCLKNWAVASCNIANTDTFYALDDGSVGIADEDEFKNVLASSNVETAIGGWYRIISQGGEPYAQPGAQPGDPLLRDKSKTSGNLLDFLNRQPRTLIGVSDDRVYLVVVDGRQMNWSAGLTLNGCGRILYSLGCKRGINMDGGGSTVLVSRSGNDFKTMNMPSDLSEREVVNSLLVIARP